MEGEPGETKLCSNCKRDISAANYVMHEMHCRRHIVLCEHCKEPFPRVELDQHFNDVHAKVPCERCRQEVCRNEVESHMERECAKKPMMCDYCELTFPKDEYESHIDYCGSRTECCDQCQQYIMLKDRTIHEASDCMYPEPKPTPPQPATNSDPFSMAHLQDFLDIDSRLRAADDIPDFTASLRRELRQFDDGRAHQNVSTSSRRTRNTQANRTTEPSRQDGNDWDASDVPGSGSSPWEAIPPDMDYDTMLALQLAHEDWAEDNVNGNRDQTSSPNPVEVPNLQDDILNDPPSDTLPEPPHNQEFYVEDGDMTIPCEFCEMEVPMTTYLEHAEVCPMSGAATSNDRNNELPVTHSSNQRNAIPVINNLGSERQQGLSDPNLIFDENHFANDDVALPCEFCEDIFPIDLIVQHQSVCPANGLATPRVTTPATGQRSKWSSHQPNSTFVKSSSSSLPLKEQHQPDPESVVDLDSSDDDGEGPQSNFFRDESYKNSLQSASDKYINPGVPRFDDSLTRPPRRGNRQSSFEKNQDVGRAPQTDLPRPSKSAQRTRASLNQLLQDDEGAMGPTSSSTQIRGMRRSNRGRSGGNQTTAETTAVRPSHVSSRTVMRELDRARPAPSGRSSRQTHSTHPSNLPPTGATGESSTGARGNSTTARQNRNPIFSPELRLKPDHNPPRRRR